MKNIVIGNAASTNHIWFRNDFEKFLTNSNRDSIEESVCAFLSLHPGLAIQNLFKMSCQPRENVPEGIWQKMHLEPAIISDDMWIPFVHELRFQYKRAHPEFMTEFDIPSECTSAYNSLVGATCEVAAYLFYKNAYFFLVHNSRDHISGVFKYLDWHSKDPDVIKDKHIKGLKRLSLAGYAAEYFEPHCKKVLNLLQTMDAHMKNNNQEDDELPFTLESLPSADSSVQDIAVSEAPVSEGTPAVPAPEVTPKAISNLELSLENIQKHENEFREFIFNNSATALVCLMHSGFTADVLLAKSPAVCSVLHALDTLATAKAELDNAVSALSM